MKRLLIAILIVAALSLTGCNVLNPEEYMKAPKAQGIYAKVEEALKNSVGTNITLKFPRMGENLSAFISVADGSKDDNMVAIYVKNSDTNPVIHLNLLKNKNGKWVSLDDVETSITEIDSIDVENLDNDKIGELVLYYVSPLSFAGAVTVVSVDNDKLKIDLGENCTRYITCDLDDDNDSELVVLSLDTVKRESYAKLYDYADGKIKELSTARLDGNVSSYDDILIQDISDEKTFFVDGTKNSDDPDGAPATITEVIYFENGKLYAPFTDNTEYSNYETFRNKPLKTEDFDKDSKYEIPLISEINKNIYLIDYFSFDSGNKTLKPKNTVYKNDTDGYYLVLDNIETPESFDIDEKKGKTVFSAKGKVGFTIIATSVDDYEEYKDYDLLQMTADKVYLVKVEGNVTFEEVKVAFNLKD